VELCGSNAARRYVHSSGPLPVAGNAHLRGPLGCVVREPVFQFPGRTPSVTVTRWSAIKPSPKLLSLTLSEWNPVGSPGVPRAGRGGSRASSRGCITTGHEAVAQVARLTRAIEAAPVRTLQRKQNSPARNSARPIRSNARSILHTQGGPPDSPARLSLAFFLRNPVRAASRDLPTPAAGLEEWT
jgi:hypothetical protein